MNYVVRKLLEDARENGANDAVVLKVPETMIEKHDGLIGKDENSSMRAESRLFAGPVEKETDSTISLKTPSRVGEKDDFNDDLRSKLRVTDVYGFRDGCLDGIELDKTEIEIYRVNDLKQ
ncbi:MAG: hypothetical protein ABEK59_06375 [Halobacteria archaeon]